MNKKIKVINGQIHRSPKRGAVQYTPISNQVLQNNNLSFEARGLLSYLLSLPQDWVVVKSQVKSTTKIGTVKFDRIWKELQDAGHIYSEKVRDPFGGMFLGWAHVVYEEPISVKPEFGKNRTPITPLSEDHIITKEEITKKETKIQKKQGSVEANKLDSLPSTKSLFDIISLYPHLPSEEQIKIYHEQL
jgi:hypothetical protein